MKTKAPLDKKVFETHDSSSDEDNRQDFQVLFVPGQDLATYGFNNAKKKRTKKLQAADTLESLKRSRKSADDDSDNAASGEPSSARKPARSRNSVEFEVIYAAFSVFKEIYGHLNVHKDFVVPKTEQWPTEAWGLLLGRRLYCMRMENTYPEQRDRLLALGVNFDVKPKHNKPHKAAHVITFPVLYAALVAYKNIHGNVDVPCRYVIGADDDRFPEEARELPLGSRLRRIRENKTYLEYRDTLIELGVRFNTEDQPKKPTPKIVDFEVIYDSFVIYKRLHGDLNIAYNFVVPEGDSDYPPAAWGLRLGHRMQHIRNDNAYQEHRDRLTALGITFTEKSTQAFAPIYAALQAYKRIHRNVDVPQKYVIEQGDERYPPQCWGLALGRRVNLIRSRQTYPEHKQELLALGFSFDLARLPEVSFEVVHAALESYKQLRGDLKVPVRYIVAAGDENFPEEAWGLRLGQQLQTIRNGSIFAEHREKLTELGVRFLEGGEWEADEEDSEGAAAAAAAAASTTSGGQIFRNSSSGGVRARKTNLDDDSSGSD